MVDGIMKIKIKKKYETNTSYNILVNYIYIDRV